MAKERFITDNKQEAKMKIKKLFKDCGMPYHHVVQFYDGSFAKFVITPFRKITDKDLSKLAYYPDTGRKSAEAELYMYKFYGLEK